MRIKCKRINPQNIAQLDNQYLIIICDALQHKRYCGRYHYDMGVLNGAFCIEHYTKKELVKNTDGYCFSPFWLIDYSHCVFIISKQDYEFYFLKRCHTENDFKKIFNCLEYED